MTRQMIMTCDCCLTNQDAEKMRELGLVVRFGVAPATTRAFDFCEDCLTKVAGHPSGDPRCSKSIIHQSEQAVLAMFKAEVKKFDDGVVPPGDSSWACACGQKNAGYATQCGRCGRTKEGGGT